MRTRKDLINIEIFLSKNDEKIFIILCNFFFMNKIFLYFNYNFYLEFEKSQRILHLLEYKDQFSGTPVSDVNVKLQAQVLQDNVFSTAYQTIASAVTNQQGSLNHL